MDIAKDTTYDSVFYATDEHAPEAYPILVICPRIYRSEQGEWKIAWRNTDRGMEFMIGKIEFIKHSGQELIDSKHPPKEMIITTDNDQILILRLLTCEVYYNKMNNIARKPKFKDDEELQTFYKAYNPDLEAYRGLLE
jgi:hypothetical protein